MDCNTPTRLRINMTIVKCSVALLILCSVLSFAAKLPPEVKRCDRKQADFDDCLVKAVQGAVELIRDPIPQVGLPRIDPLDVPELTIGAGTGAVSVQQNYKNVKVIGFTNVKIQSVKFDFEQKKLKLSALLSKVQMKADYDLDGKVLLLPIKGTGPSTLTLDNVQVELQLDFDIVEKKGKKYFIITGSKLDMTPDFVSYDFVNLFNGNKELGDNINKILNENWKEVFNDVKGGYEEAYGIIFRSLSEALFSRVPIRDIFLNETEF